MIKIFDGEDKVYSTNGNLVVNPTLAKVHKADNGDFYLDLETPLIENEKERAAETGTYINGTSFTIQDYDSTKLVELTQIEGNTTQSGTPTPTSPQPINVVSGRQEVSVCGKNLLGLLPNQSVVVNGVTISTTAEGYLKLNGTATAQINKSYNWIVENPTYTSQAYTYSITYVSGTVSNSFVINTRSGSTTTDISNQFNPSSLYTNVSGNSTTFTPSGSGYITGIQIMSSSGYAFNNFIVKLQIESGSTATPYEEFKGQSYEINLGKNLFTLQNISSTTNLGIERNVDNSKITLNGTSTGAGGVIGRTSTKITIPKGTYYFSMTNISGVVVPNSKFTAFYLRKPDGTQLAGINVNRFTIENYVYSQQITFNEDTLLYVELYCNGANYEFNNITFEIQLEKGTQSTNWVQYKTPIELCKIGTYQDRIYKDNGTWYLHKEIGKVVLNGSENWSGGTIAGNYLYIYSNTYDNILLPNKSYLGLSNYFKVLDQTINTYTPVITTDSISLGSDTPTAGNRVRIKINKTTANTLANFKTWLNSHNTIVYYVLATPTTTEITDTELISQLNGIELLEGLNNVSVSSADLPSPITLYYNYLDGYKNITKYIDYLVPNNIIVANTPQGEQAFRITNVEKTRRKIKIKAYHVFYDSENLLIQDSYVVDKNCNDALDHLNNATSDLSPFTTISNINTIANYRCVRKSLYEAIQVVLERWGGHLVRDNWSIGIYDTIGQDNGVTIRYAKNLKEMTATYNWDDVVTKLLPVGKNGILLNELDPTASLYVESALKYDIPYTKTISFEQNSIVEDDYKDEFGEVIEEEYKQALIDDLFAQATEYINNNYLPKVNYTLSANVEKVSDVGDSIEVIDEKLGINIMTNIISYDYDCILNRYLNLEFGNFTPTLNGLIDTITNNTEKLIQEENSTLAITLGRELDEATSKIWSALGNSYVIYDGDKILVVDSLPKETATNVIMINNGGIGFSNTGITGTFSSAWTIDNVLNMENINVINLTADLVKGGTLKLGSNLNQNGKLEVYDEANNLIAELNKNGLKMYGVDGSYVLMNNQVGFAGYDRNNNPVYWVSKDEFHMKKSVVEEEITLVNKMRIIPITIRNGNTIVNDGIGFINVPN